MKILRGAVIALLTLLAIVTVLCGALLTSLSFTLASPTYVKTTLAKTQTYDQVPAIVTQIMESENEGDSGDNAELPEEARTLINDAIRPADLQTGTEPAIDNIFAWLDGDTASPEFSISLFSSHAAGIDTAGDEAKQFMNETKFTSDNFDMPTEQVERIQSVYDWLKLASWIAALALIMIALLLALVFITKKIYRTGVVISLVGGMGVLIFGVARLSEAVMRSLAETFLWSKIPDIQKMPILQTNLELLLQRVFIDITTYALLSACLVLVVGVVLVISGLGMDKKHK